MDNKKDRVDFISKFLCTVPKLLYMLLLPLLFSIMLDVFTTIDMEISNVVAYWIILVLLILIIFSEYIICRAYKIKKECLNEKKLTVGIKFRNIFITVIITLAFEIIVPNIHTMYMIHKIYN